MKEHLRTAVTKEVNTINEHGELIAQDLDKIKYVAGSTDEYFMIFSGAIALLEKGMTDAEIRLYAHILNHYSTGADIGMSKQVRIGISSKIDLNERTILNCLSSLTERHLLYLVRKGVYKINPRYAYKGSLENRKKDLKFMLEVECPKC